MSRIRHRGRPNRRLTALSYAQRVWEALDTPVSLACSILASNGEYEQLVRKGVNPLNYTHSADFYADYSAVKLLSKFPDLPTGIDRRLAAMKKFIEAEVLCRETNERFRDLSGHGVSQLVQRVLDRARQVIQRILGDVPSLEQLDFRFGPGASYGVRGETSVYNKVTSTLECTYAFQPLLSEFLGEFPGWISQDWREVALVSGSELTFVPKDAKTDRPICIEPLLNGLYQKGVGSWLRNRLKRFGIDLNDQSVNQRLAQKAFTERLSTVDFSSASDTIAHNLVLDLLPIDWFEFLDIARCPRYFVEGKWYNFHKFTSMGNAYTFELETLIFFGLAFACCQELGIDFVTGVNLSVYGDDVIIPRDCFDLFQEVTVACGFLINTEKSFTDGLFFESCGHDYFSGDFVRPFLLKRELNTLTAAFYATNTTLRLSKRLGAVGSPTATRLLGVRKWCIDSVPGPFRTWGPEGFGDGHIVEELDAVCPPRHPSWDGWWIRSWVESSVRVARPDWPMGYALYFAGGSTPHRALSHLIGVEKEPTSAPPDNGSGYTVRNRTRIRLSRIFVPSEWRTDESNDAQGHLD